MSEKKLLPSLLMTPTPLFHRGSRRPFHLIPFTVTASLAPSEVFSPMGRLRIWVWRKALINCIRNELNHLTSGACHSKVIGQRVQHGHCAPWKATSWLFYPSFVSPSLQIYSCSNQSSKVDQQKAWGYNQCIQTDGRCAKWLSRRNT